MVFFVLTKCLKVDSGVNTQRSDKIWEKFLAEGGWARNTSGSQKLTVLRKRHSNSLFFEANNNKDNATIALASSIN